ncbi:MAG: hypothetical protein WCT14_11370 [Treponemataceae bacterium]
MKSELTRLEQISRRLASLNETLSNELKDSKRNSEELALSLENSKRELSSLSSELEASRLLSTELARTAVSSETELRELRTALTKAEFSLRNLETSFGAYRKEAEAQLSRLKNAGFFSRIVAIVSSLFAVAGWTAFFIIMLF